MIDFTNCKPDKFSDYAKQGSDQKWGVFFNNSRYMIKLADKTSSEQKNSLRDSYSNSVYSEYICCHIIQLCGYDAQNTLLGQVQRDNTIKPVVACENFIPEGYKLVDFKEMQHYICQNKPGKIPKISEIYEVMKHENSYFNQEQCDNALKRYWDTFIFDAFLGNFDRHGNNWAYLINRTNENDIRLAPIFDCGSCLYPQIADEAISSILSNEVQVLERINKFPTAALELDDGKKANYRDYINSLANSDCNEALKRVYPLITNNMTRIREFINNMTEISDIRKEFYKTMLTKRHEIILTPAYEKIMNLEKISVTSRSFDENVTRAYQQCKENKELHTQNPIKNNSIDR